MKHVQQPKVMLGRRTRWKAESISFSDRGRGMPIDEGLDFVLSVCIQ